MGPLPAAAQDQQQEKKEQQQSQGSSILNDTSEQNPRFGGTRFFKEAALYYEKDTAFQPLDTSVRNFHEYDFTEAPQTRYTNLGNLGSPLKPLYYQPPERIGTRLGISVFDPIAFDPGNLPYYDTKSPYSYLFYTQGSHGRQRLVGELARNIDVRSSVGLKYQRIGAHKQIGTQESRDIQVDNHTLALSGRFASNDGRYRLLANYTYLSHEYSETGGIYAEPGTPRSELFDYEVEEVWLSGDARNRDRRNAWHLYHDYRLDSNAHLRPFHVFDRLRQQWLYEDPEPINQFPEDPQQREFYPRFLVDTAQTQQEDIFHVYRNKLGLKGKFGRFRYAGYYRRQDFTFNSSLATTHGRGHEQFAGGWLRISQPGSDVHLSAEKMLGGEDFLVNARILSPYFQGSHRSMRFQPSLMAQSYFSNHYAWENDFNAPTVHRTRLMGKFSPWLLELRPFLSNTLISNFIYYGSNAEPQQETDPVNQFQLGLELDADWRQWHLESRTVYTNIGGPELISVPELTSDVRVFFGAPLFNKALRLETGLAMKWRDAYQAYGYAPSIRQFHLQNDFLLSAYNRLDVYANARIGSALVFVKVAHFNRGLFSEESGGFFVADGYPGIRALLEFGVKWMFFD